MKKEELTISGAPFLSKQHFQQKVLGMQKHRDMNIYNQELKTQFKTASRANACTKNVTLHIAYSVFAYVSISCQQLFPDFSYLWFPEIPSFIYVHVCVYIYTHIYMYMYTHLHIYMCLQLSMCECLQKYIYVYQKNIWNMKSQLLSLPVHICQTYMLVLRTLTKITAGSSFIIWKGYGSMAGPSGNSWCQRHGERHYSKCGY